MQGQIGRVARGQGHPLELHQLADCLLGAGAQSRRRPDVHLGRVRPGVRTDIADPEADVDPTVSGRLDLRLRVVELRLREPIAEGEQRGDVVLVVPPVALVDPVDLPSPSGSDSWSSPLARTGLGPTTPG